MKVTKKEYHKLGIIHADVSAQAYLLEIGATNTKEKLYASIDGLADMLKNAEIIDDA